MVADLHHELQRKNDELAAVQRELETIKADNVNNAHTLKTINPHTPQQLRRAAAPSAAAEQPSLAPAAPQPSGGLSQLARIQLKHSDAASALASVVATVEAFAAVAAQPMSDGGLVHHGTAGSKASVISEQLAELSDLRAQLAAMHLAAAKPAGMYETCI